VRKRPIAFNLFFHMFPIKSMSRSVAGLPDPVSASHAAIQGGRLHVAAVQLGRLSLRLVLVCSAPRTLLHDLPVAFFTNKRVRHRSCLHGKWHSEKVQGLPIRGSERFFL
jgi:hypothetical protein